MTKSRINENKYTDIYEPAEDSYLLQKYVKEHAEGRVLDIGTGSGIQAITATENKNVKEVLAVDINPKAVKQLKENSKLNKKLKVKESDLFENVEGQYNLIIFNPPYLPEDKGIEDMALYGGKKGWEISERFFADVSKHLISNGKILFLFSSLTDKDKIEQLTGQNLLQFKLLGTEKLSFETLYVYLIEKSDLLKRLSSKGIENIHYFTHGKRGDIYTGFIDQSKLVKTHLAKKEIVKVAIKIKRKESKATNRIKNEAHWLSILNKSNNIGPQLLFYDSQTEEQFLVYRFVEGEFILDWLSNNPIATIDNIRMVLANLLEQCFEMDQLKVDKEEMHHPQKHVLITDNAQPILLDFERCNLTDTPKNVTQCIEFICRLKEELHKKKLKININQLRELAKEYKKEQNQDNFNKIITKIS